MTSGNRDSSQSIFSFGSHAQRSRLLPVSWRAYFSLDCERSNERHDQYSAPFSNWISAAGWCLVCKDSLTILVWDQVPDQKRPYQRFVRMCYSIVLIRNIATVAAESFPLQAAIFWLPPIHEGKKQNSCALYFSRRAGWQILHSDARVDIEHCSITSSVGKTCVIVSHVKIIHLNIGLLDGLFVREMDLLWNYHQGNSLRSSELSLVSEILNVRLTAWLAMWKTAGRPPYLYWCRE